MGSRCFFAGHSDAPSSIQAALVDAVEFHIVNYGVTEFYIGQYGAFDRMAAKAVAEAKVRHLDVKFYLALAYYPPTRYEAQVDFDGYYYPEGQETVPRRAAIPKLNMRMVNMSDYLISYVTHISGGAYKILKYARKQSIKRELVITNLGGHI